MGFSRRDLLCLLSGFRCPAVGGGGSAEEVDLSIGYPLEAIEAVAVGAAVVAVEGREELVGSKSNLGGRGWIAERSCAMAAVAII